MRTVIRARLFEAMVRSQLHPDVRRCDEVLMGVEWAIAVNAEAFPLLGHDTDLRAVKTTRFPDVPPFVVYFTIDDEHICTLQGLHVIETYATEDDVYF